MKVWITKYVLSNGIVECDGELCEDGFEIMRAEGSYSVVYLHGKGVEWHETLDAAIVRANEVRGQKIKSLQNK